MLFWGEQFSFEDLPPTESVTISLFRESDTKKKRKPDKNVFVGSSVIDLVNLETNTEIEKWVSIHIPGISPKLQQKTTISSKTEQPSIRTKLKYETNVVLPLENYKKLHKYLNDNYLILTSTLEVLISLKTKDLLAQTLLKVLMSSNKAESFLVDVIMNEVKNTADENLTFRGNSLATKSIDTYMKIIGKYYIQETLVTFINSVYELEGDTEVDPQKLTTQNGCLSDNQRCLIKLVEDAWRSIFLSLQIFPKNLQLVFSMVRKRCELLERDIVKKIVSASLFLRLLCPAILSPSLFLLTPEYPSEKVARTLTLVAKTIQNLANFTRFGSKEGYMEILNDFVEREIANMDNFLQRISYEPDCINDNETSCPACMNIDLARELSVIYHLLSSELAKLSPDSAIKLNDLKIILDEIKLVYESSPKAEELRLCRPFASVALVCSKPLTTPTSGQRDDTPVSHCGIMTPSSTVDESEYDPETPTCYLDTTLSLLEDHVTGCSPVCTKRELMREPSVLIHSNQAEILTKNTFVNASDITLKIDQCKCDVSSESIESNTSKEERDKSPPIVPESKQKSEHLLANRKKHIFDSTSSRKNIRETGTVKARINMFSNRNEPLPAKRNVTKQTNIQTYSQNVKQTNIQTYSQNVKQTNIQTYSQNVKQTDHINLTRNNNLEKIPENNSLKKVVIKPPLIIPKLGTSKTNQKTSEKVLPRQNSVDDDLTLDVHSSESESLHNSNQNGYPNRTKLKLHSLQKDHYFVDEMVLRDNCNQSTEQKKTLCCDTVTSISNSITQNIHRNNGKRHVSSCEPRAVHLSSDRLRNSSGKEYEIQRRHSEMTSSESERNNFNRNTMVVDQSTEITQIHSNGYCEILHEGIIERTNSITSSCSSNCTYSSESYFSDEEYETYISGDSLSEALQQQSHM